MGKNIVLCGGPGAGGNLDCIIMMMIEIVMSICISMTL